MLRWIRISLNHITLILARFTYFSKDMLRGSSSMANLHVTYVCLPSLSKKKIIPWFFSRPRFIFPVPLGSSYGQSCRIMESQSHRTTSWTNMGGNRAFISSNLPAQAWSSQSTLYRILARWFLSILSEWHSTTSLGSLFQCSITCTIKMLFLFHWAFIWSMISVLWSTHSGEQLEKNLTYSRSKQTQLEEPISLNRVILIIVLISTRIVLLVFVCLFICSFVFRPE